MTLAFSATTTKVKQDLTHWGRDEMNNISQTTFSNIFWISIKISLKFVPYGQINNIPALV